MALTVFPWHKRKLCCFVLFLLKIDSFLGVFLAVWSPLSFLDVPLLVTAPVLPAGRSATSENF